MAPRSPQGGDPEALTGPAGIDPELAALPAPPRARRLATLVLMALVAAGALGLLASLGDDLGYLLSRSPAADLGEAVQVDPASLTANSYVRVRGTPMLSHALRYSRMWNDGEYAVFPLAGQRHVFVRVAAPDLERFRMSPRREFAGRLVTFGQLGSEFSAVREAFAQRMGPEVSSETFLVLADEPPGRYGWVILVALVCLLFVAVDVALMVRWFRPIKEPR